MSEESNRGPVEDSNDPESLHKSEAGKEDPGKGQDMSEDELRKRLQDELRKIKVEDVVLQASVTLVNVGFHRLGLTEDTKDDRDLDQVGSAIEAVSSLIGLVESTDAEQIKPLKDALSQLQLNFVRLTEAGDSEQLLEKEEQKEQTEPADRPVAGVRKERPSGSKLWTPPGT